MHQIQRRGFMLVLSSPSGAGKTSIANRLLAHESSLEVSISVTTRPMRPGEVHGQDYFFVSKQDYEKMIANKELLEHATVFGHGYGTPKQSVFDALSQGKDVIFDIDWQGTQQLSQLARADLVSVFILPPSTGELERRLRARAQDTDDVIARRMSEAAHEMSHWAEYDYVVINRDLEQSIAYVNSILIAERLRRNRQKGLIDFVNNLRRENIREQIQD